jgi:hypothetical protein
MTDEEVDAYEAARRAERAVADGTGDEDEVDRWMAEADRRR